MLRAVCLAASLLAMPSGAAAQAGAPQVSPVLTLPSPGCVRDFEEHTNIPFDVCGYASVALNADATRILAISVGGRADLFDSEGRLIQTINRVGLWYPAYRTAAFFTGDHAISLVDGRVNVLRADSGSVVNSYGIGSRSGYLLHTDNEIFFRDDDGSTVVAVDTVSGARTAARENVRFLDYGPHPRWSLGNTIISDGELNRHQIVLADRELSMVETPRECRPLNEPMRCVSFDYRTLSGSILDLQTGFATDFDLQTLVSSTTLVEWRSIGADTIALVRTGFRTLATGGTVAQFAIIEVSGPRLIYAFEGSTPLWAVGESASGVPEIRLAVSAQEYSAPLTVSRIDPLSGTLLSVGVGRDRSHVALVTPNNDTLVPDPEMPTRTLSIRSGGQVRATFEFDAERCNQHLLWIYPSFCSFSTDGSAVAVINASGGVSVFRIPE